MSIIPLRNRCKVLQAISTHGPISCRGLRDIEMDLTSLQIRRAVQNLKDEGRIEKVGEEKKNSSAGRAFALFEVTDHEPIGKPRPRKGKKRTSKTHAHSLQGSNSGLANDFVRFRERKIAILTAFADTSGGTDKDVIIGMIKDYGGVY